MHLVISDSLITKTWRQYVITGKSAALSGWLGPLFLGFQSHRNSGPTFAGGLSRMATGSSTEAPQVTIIARNPATIDGLHAYLSRAGLALQSTRELQDACLVSPEATAVVVFPDDFDMKDVLASVTWLRRARPLLLVLIVSSTPQHYRLAAPAGSAQSLLVLPKPAFGWAILDAIRDHASSGEP